MSKDPIEVLYNEETSTNVPQEEAVYVNYIDSSTSWNTFRANLAAQMFEDRQHHII